VLAPDCVASAPCSPRIARRLTAVRRARPTVKAGPGR
jgi:hypothetical protein